MYMRNLTLSCLCGVALMLSASAAHSSTTKEWRFSSSKDFSTGTLKGLSLHDDGILTVAPGLKRQEVGAELIHCWARDGDKLWLGTGLSSKIYLLQNGKVKEVASIGGALVGSLVADGAGGVYAGSVGSGKVFHVSSAGKVRTLAALTGAKYVWALARDGEKLYAGTGPGGGVFEVATKTGKASLYAETGAEHVLTLLKDGKSWIAGTSDAATLIRIEGRNKVRAIAGFPGNEIRSVVRVGDALYATVNGGNSAASLSRLRPTRKRPGGASMAKTVRKKKRVKKKSRGGKGAVWAVHDDGRIHRLFVSPVGMLSQLAALDGKVVAGSNRDGRVVVGDMAGTIASLFDLDEEQVLGVETSAGKLKTLFTGKSAVVYTVGGDAKERSFTTEVLRETGISRWGRVQVQGAGKLKIETRSGFANPPSETWSPWQVAKGGQVQSPAATYLQVRVTFGNADAKLHEMRVFRRPFNRRPTVANLSTSYDAKRKRTRVSWAGQDLDGDTLGYVVTYRKQGSQQWLKLHDRYYSKTSLYIAPNDMPDGWYEVRVQVSDAASNPPPETLTAALISPPFLIDQGRPVVKAKVSGDTLSGVASDAVSRVVKLEVSVDGAPPLHMSAKDGVLDATSEAFSFKLPAAARSGAHTLLVQATDEAGNTGVVRLVIGK